MHDFVEYILRLFERGMYAAVFAVAFCALAVGIAYLLFRRVTKGEKRFPWGKAVLCLLLVGYAAILLYATLLRHDAVGSPQKNLYLFCAWREAWNSFSLQNWLNVLLNVAMFVPLGVLLPLLAKCFRKWYGMLAVGFGTSLLIEAVQYFTARGVFDVDDLFANTLGAMIGFGATMVCIVACRRGKRRTAKCFAYASVPLAFALAMAGIFGGYSLQEYGNLPEAPTFTVDTSGVEWQLACALSTDPAVMPIYRTEPFRKASCDAFGAAFAEKLGITFADTYYYDNCTIFANHFTGDFLNVSYFDRSYSYSVGGIDDAERAEVDEETLRLLLAPYDITIPDTAEFVYEGNGWHSFTVDMSFAEDAIFAGTLRCRCNAQPAIEEIENQLVSYGFYKEAEICTETEAYARLRAGKFSPGNLFDRYAPARILVRSCTTEYRIDTKGFYRPVYVFAVEMDDMYSAELIVTAMP